jgi:tetratricopeptide (TPR) repeat protein
MASFATRNPSRLVARYLHADALARSGRHQEALALWDSLATTNHHALSLNARGVLYATLGQLDKAGEDFAAAVAAAPDFADALANRGLRLLQKKSGARGALAWFEKAMEKSADFALARFGHGCAHFALGNYDKAFADLRIVKTNDCIFSNLMVVVSAMSDYMTVRPDPKLADASTDEVGTILDRHLADLVVSPDQGNYNRVIGDWQAQPREVQSRMLGRIQDLARGNPGFASRLDQLNRNSLDWNRTGGWGEMFASLSGASVSAFGFGGSPGSTFAQRQMDITRRNYDLSERISRTLGSSRITPVNGVTTRAANVHAEELEAYFFPGYGLHLPAPGRNDLPHLNPK